MPNTEKTYHPITGSVEYMEHNYEIPLATKDIAMPKLCDLGEYMDTGIHIDLVLTDGGNWFTCKANGGTYSSSVPKNVITKADVELAIRASMPYLMVTPNIEVNPLLFNRLILDVYNTQNTPYFTDWCGNNVGLISEMETVTPTLSLTDMEDIIELVKMVVYYVHGWSNTPYPNGLRTLITDYFNKCADEEFARCISNV